MTQFWKDAEHHSARLVLDRFSAQVDPTRPAAGLQQVTVDGTLLEAFHPLAVELPEITGTEAQHLERYVRGGDLVATYSDRPAPQMRSQIYWRSDAHRREGAIAAVELVASVQTALLDSYPRLTLRSKLLAGEAFQLVDPASGTFSSLVPPQNDVDPEAVGAPLCYLFRFTGRQYSYAEMVFPAAAQSSTWDGWLHRSEYRLELRHELFSERLEKGVILRARVLGLLLERRNDKAAAAHHWSTFLAEQLPLTT